MECQSQDLPGLELTAEALGWQAMRHRWGLRAEHRCNSNNYTKDMTVG